MISTAAHTLYFGEIKDPRLSGPENFDEGLQRCTAALGNDPIKQHQPQNVSTGQIPGEAQHCASCEG